MNHVLSSPRPIRAYAIGAALCALGSALVPRLSWGLAWSVTGAALLFFGLVLLISAWAVWRRNRVRVETSPAGYIIRGRGHPASGTWASVTRVTLSESGNEITLHHGPEHRTRLITPGHAPHPELASLAAEFARLLEISRGYGATPF